MQLDSRIHRQIEGDAAMNGVAEPQVTIETDGSVERHGDDHAEVQDAAGMAKIHRRFHLVLDRKHNSDTLEKVVCITVNQSQIGLGIP